MKAQVSEDVAAIFKTYDLHAPHAAADTLRNLWRRVLLRQTCCGHPGEPGC